MRKKIYVCSKLRSTAKKPEIREIEMSRNIEKAKEACRMVVDAGNVPFAPHLYFTQFLNDDVQEERQKGMEFGIDLIAFCDELWVFLDDVISAGMMDEIEEAIKKHKPIKVFTAGGRKEPAIENAIYTLFDAADDFSDDEDLNIPEDIDDEEDFQWTEEALESLHQKVFGDEDGGKEREKHFYEKEFTELSLKDIEDFVITNLANFGLDTDQTSLTISITRLEPDVYKAYGLAEVEEDTDE